MTTLDSRTARNLLDMLAGTTAGDPMLGSPGPGEVAYTVCDTHPACIAVYKSFFLGGPFRQTDWMADGHISLQEIVAALDPSYRAASKQQLVDELERRAPRASRSGYPLELFQHYASRFPTTNIEALAIRFSGHAVEVLVVDRQPSDDGYAGSCHLPGKFMLNDEEVTEALRRVVTSETGAEFTRSQFIGILNDPREVHGHQLHHLFAVTIDGAKPTKGRWIDVTQLPENFLEHHLVLLYMGLRALLASADDQPGVQLEEFWWPTEADVANYTSLQAHHEIGNAMAGTSEDMHRYHVLNNFSSYRDYWQIQIAHLVRAEQARLMDRHLY